MLTWKVQLLPNVAPENREPRPCCAGKLDVAVWEHKFAWWGTEVGRPIYDADDSNSWYDSEAFTGTTITVQNHLNGESFSLLLIRRTLDGTLETFCWLVASNIGDIFRLHSSPVMSSSSCGSDTIWFVYMILLDPAFLLISDMKLPNLFLTNWGVIIPNMIVWPKGTWQPIFKIQIVDVNPYGALLVRILCNTIY